MWIPISSSLNGAEGRIRTDVDISLSLTRRAQSTAMRLQQMQGTKKLIMGLEPMTVLRQIQQRPAARHHIRPSDMGV